MSLRQKPGGSLEPQAVDSTHSIVTATGYLIARIGTLIAASLLVLAVFWFLAALAH